MKSGRREGRVEDGRRWWGIGVLNGEVVRREWWLVDTPEFSFLFSFFFYLHFWVVEAWMLRPVYSAAFGGCLAIMHVGLFGGLIGWFPFCVTDIVGVGTQVKRR